MKSIDLLRVKAQAEIINHKPAKDAPVLNEDEKKDVEQFKALLDLACLADRGERRPVTAFQPSGLGAYAGKCQRRWVYLFRGVVPISNIDARTSRIFGNGTGVHERLQAIIDNMGLEHQKEARLLHDDPPIRGYIDGIITLPWNGRKIVLELKSINENGFISRKKWKKAKDEHFAQANLYAYIFDIDTIWMVYENKNDQDIEIFESKMDPKAAEKQLNIWRKTWAMHQEDKLPKRPYKLDSQACMSCDLRNHCLSDEEIGE